ncbi:hypothetical protein [Mycobacterium canetti]|uniref:hypothetical protein n=1 Tax=Mycobacterium canetti TaxID=78331 RepID=UPI0002A59785|nr:hypothetical protein [Mycobacterium canetti]CCK60410.1 Conserved protein of unknown function [Mycobacterium canettii CIPT 140070010]
MATSSDDITINRHPPLNCAVNRHDESRRSPLRRGPLANGLRDRQAGALFERYKSQFDSFGYIEEVRYGGSGHRVEDVYARADSGPSAGAELPVGP